MELIYPLLQNDCQICCVKIWLPSYKLCASVGINKRVCGFPWNWSLFTIEDINSNLFQLPIFVSLTVDFNIIYLIRSTLLSFHMKMHHIWVVVCKRQKILSILCRFWLHKYHRLTCICSPPVTGHQPDNSARQCIPSPRVEFAAPKKTFTFSFYNKSRSNYAKRKNNSGKWNWNPAVI